MADNFELRRNNSIKSFPTKPDEEFTWLRNFGMKAKWRHVKMEKAILLDLKNEIIVCAPTPWSLAFDRRPSIKSVLLGLFCPNSKADGLLWVTGGVENGANIY